MKRIAIVLLTVIMMLTSCTMKGEIYLANLKKMYPEAEITADGEAFVITFTDFTATYDAELDIGKIALTDIEEGYIAFRGSITNKNKYTFRFENKEFSDYKPIMTVTVADSLESGLTGEIDIVINNNRTDIEAKTMVHGIPEGEYIFVVDADYNLIGLI